MSTDRTPIDRGAEALDAALSLVDDGYPSSTVHAVTRDTLSAALTNDADPDWLMRAAILKEA